MSQGEKFDKILDFAKHLPKIRNRVRRDMTESKITREIVLATIVWLLENTLIRVGNEEYAQENNSFGLTTLENRHARVNTTDKFVFQFKGKSGIYHKVSIRNKKVAKILRRIKDLPGQSLFQYLDENGEIQSVDSYDVNEYLKNITGEEFSAKDFRTWGGTVLAAAALNKLGITEKEEGIKQNIVDAVKEASSFLRNKPATCKKYYIHPVVLETYTKGFVLSNMDIMPKKKRYFTIGFCVDCYCCCKYNFSVCFYTN